jgi:hypothetical protein
MAAREAYARGAGYNEAAGTECHPGLEIREGDDVDLLTHWLQAHANRAVDRWGGNHLEVVRQVEEAILEAYPGRAYFIETEEDGRGVQVYQPFGMPRAVETRIAHAAGCLDLPRTTRGCHCGTDHQ